MKYYKEPENCQSGAKAAPPWSRFGNSANLEGGAVFSLVIMLTLNPALSIALKKIQLSCR